MSHLQQARAHTIQGMSRISKFWGFPKGMGAIYGAVYLSRDPVSLDELVKEIGISKGAVSTNVRQLERLGLVHKHIEIGDRKDFYTAETDFWKVVKGILREREKSEFDKAIRTASESLEMIETTENLTAEEAETARFYQQRLSRLAEFFRNLDNLVAALLALESIKSNVLNVFSGSKNE